MNKTALKQLPSFATDEEAEQFVDTADLSEYDLSGFVPLNLALNQPEDETYILVPNDLAAALRARAEQRGIPFALVVREALERGIAG
jgi:predicted DNA binding CopG/RHH family protein